MRFIAGPRQSGKTTLAKAHLDAESCSVAYWNWDQRDIKIKHAKGVDLIRESRAISPSQKHIQWACFDEIHKMPKWKNILKSYFDAYEDSVRFLITGSARLDLFRKSGDSLAGRYFLFHLLPLNLFELTRKSEVELEHCVSASDFIQRRIAHTRHSDQSTMEALLAYSGFPEPFFHADASFLRLWQRDGLDRLVREDLRDLTRIAHLENVATLVTLLPARIGSPLSVNSLRGDLEVSHEAIRNYLDALRLCYVLFELCVYTKKINRSLKKERKVYFFDWTRMPDLGKQFENYVAVELFGWTMLWSDSGIGTFELQYIKNRKGQECDFLILKNREPWLLIEAKLKDEPLAPHLYHFASVLGGIPLVQIVKEEGVLHVGKQNDYKISASRFLSA